MEETIFAYKITQTPGQDKQIKASPCKPLNTLNTALQARVKQLQTNENSLLVKHLRVDTNVSNR